MRTAYIERRRDPGKRSRPPGRGPAWTLLEKPIAAALGAGLIGARDTVGRGSVVDIGRGHDRGWRDRAREPWAHKGRPREFGGDAFSEPRHPSAYRAAASHGRADRRATRAERLKAGGSDARCAAAGKTSLDVTGTRSLSRRAFRRMLRISSHEMGRGPSPTPLNQNRPLLLKGAALRKGPAGRSSPPDNRRGRGDSC